MAREFKDYLIGAILVSLCFISFLYFGIGFMSDNGSNTSIFDESQVNLTGLKTQMNSTTSSAQGWATSFTSDNIFVSTGTIVLFSIWGLIKLLFGGVFSIMSIFFQMLVNVLHIDPMVIGVIIVILVLGMITAAWRLIKAGE